jgi:hypothetical protein
MQGLSRGLYRLYETETKEDHLDQLRACYPDVGLLTEILWNRSMEVDGPADA